MKKTFVLIGLLFVMMLFTGIASAWDVPVLSNEVPTDGSTLWDIDTSSVNITIYTANTSTNWTIDFTPDIGSSTGTYGENGSKTCTISGMLYSTYTWVVTSFNANGTDETGNWTNASYTFTTRPAKLRENAEFNVVEQAIIGVIGIIILVGFIYIISKTDFAKKEGSLAKLLVGIIIAITLLTIIFGAL